MANTQRIKAVVDFIEKRAVNATGEKVGKGKLFFDMEAWYQEITPEDVAEAKKYISDDNPDLKECGTYMCFAGWAYYKVKGRKEWVKYQDDIWGLAAHNDTISGWAQEYFQITPDQAADLFLYSPDVHSIEGLKARITEVIPEVVFE